MSLRRESTDALIDLWSTGRAPAWGAAERDAISVKLVALSAALTPHIVADIALDDAQTQAFLLHRVRSAIDAWLMRAAAGLRASLLAARPEAPAPLGLRSAGIDELDRIDGIGRGLAGDIARTVALHHGVRDVADLDALPGIGPATLERLKRETRLDRPRVSLVSPSLLAFCTAPGAESFLRLLESSDLELFYGDAERLARRPPAGGSAHARWLRALDDIEANALRRHSPLSGALASHALAALERETVRRRYLDALAPSDGEIVLDAAYRDAMLAMIATAGRTLRLVHFVATASRRGGVGSLDIVEALEARAAAGVEVRVVLDRDRPQDPYRSAVINRPLAQRLRNAGIAVKQDMREVLLHSKCMVADRTSAIVGSHNLSTSSIADTHEISVRLDSPALAAAYADRFDALWAALP